jgi:hypothetical protein
MLLARGVQWLIIRNRILQHIGAKVPIMSLLAHGNDEVQKEALLALQKLMVTNWEYLRQ